MKSISFASTLLTIALLACLVSCYSTIPVTDITPVSLPLPVKPTIDVKTQVDTMALGDTVLVFTGCPNALITKATHKINDPSYRYRTGLEQVIANGESINVYFSDSTSYYYDTGNRLVRERKEYTGGSRTDQTFTYSPGLLVRRWVSYDQFGVEKQVFPSSMALNDRGYDNRGVYNALGQQIRPDDKYGNNFETWVRNNLVKENISNDAVWIRFNHNYDLTHLSLPNPYQFEGLGSKNLVVSEIYYPTVNGDTVRTNYTYQFNPLGRVKRKIQTSTTTSTGSTNPSRSSVSVTDYEYRCP